MFKGRQNVFHFHPHFSMMCQRLSSRPMLFATDDFRFPSHVPTFQKPSLKPKTTSCDMVYDAWLASRVIPRRRGALLVAGAQRPLTHANTKLAYTITKECAYELLVQLWGLHPFRTTVMMCLNILRGLFPAFRGYSQAMIIDEVSSSYVQFSVSLFLGGFFATGTIAHSVRSFHLEPPVAPNGRGNIKKSAGKSG
jgi:hypothetical protein